MGLFADVSASLFLSNLISAAIAAVSGGVDSPDDRSQPSTHNLSAATFGDVADRRPDTRGGTCAVCLRRMRSLDHVRELRNCSHVFHVDCIDRWVDRDRPGCDREHDHTCPLCRAPLLVTSSQGLGRDGPETSWAVERILYLFGDDLLVN